MRFALPLAALLFTAGPVIAAPQDTAAPAPAPAAAPAPALRFAWPVPSRVTVTERVLKKGKTSVLRYDAVLSARKEGGYSLNLEKLQFLELEGQDVTKGPQPPQLKVAMAVAGVLPSLVLSPEGEFEDVVGLEAATERVLKQLPEAQREPVRALLSQPAMAQGMKQRSGDFWQAWVGAWVGMDLPAGEERSGAVPVQLPSGSVDSKMTLRHRGPVAEHKGAVRLELETVLEGEPFRQAMVALMNQMMKSVDLKGKEPPDFNTMLESARRVSSVELVTEAATLRPYSARSVQLTTMRIAGQEREEREEREYSFAWPMAKKAGKRR